VNKFGLFLIALLLTSMVFNDISAYQIQVVTDNGNVFTIQNPTSTTTGSETGNGNGTGNGISAQIVTIHPQGTVISGIDSVTGNVSSLRPYNKVSTGTFAAGFQTSDMVQKMFIPQVNAQYVYSGGALTQNSTPPPNTLTPATTTVLAGSGSSTTSSSGITFTGAGSTQDVLLNSGLGSSLITGTGITGGSSAFFGSKVDPTVSITAYDGETHGYTIFSSNIGTTSGGYTVTTPVNKYVSSASNVYATYTWSWSACNMSAYTAWSWSCGYDSGTGVATVNGYVSGNYYYVTSVSFSTTDQYAANYYSHTSSSSCTAKGGCSYFQSGSSFVPYITLYDKSPFMPTALSPTFTSDFQYQFNFNSNLQYDLITQPTSGGTTIKAYNYDPSTQLYFHVTGLPANKPYQILQNGIVGISGITGSDGSLKLSAVQVAAGGQSTISGELDLYTNSPTFNSSIGTAVYDTVNNQMFNIPASSQQIYTPFAYVAFQMPSTTTIQNVVENATSLVSIPYLTKTYSAGTSMMAPIIPELKSISFTLNGTKIIVPLSTVPSSMGISIVTPGTSSNSGYSTNGSPVQISADAGGDAAAVAPKTGTMYALISASASADTAFSSSVTYNYQQTAVQYIYGVYDPSIGRYIASPCPQNQFLASGCTDHLTYASNGAHAGPLSVYVDTYVNGVMVGSQIVYNNQNPTIVQTSSVNNWSMGANSAIAMHYSQTAATGLVQVSVHAGDLVEFYLRVHVDAYGDSISVPTGTYGVFTTTSQLSTGSATINLNNGSILTGMS
jgi:hypothetical protein